MQEIVELVVFGLIAVLVGTGVLWLVGWLIGLVGSLFMWLAGLLWLVLRYIVPVFVILGAIYYLFRLLQNRNRSGSGTAQEPVVSGPRAANSTPSVGSSHTEPNDASVTNVAPAAAPVTTPQVQGLPYNPDGPAAATPEATTDVEIVEAEVVETNQDNASDNDKKA